MTYSPTIKVLDTSVIVPNLLSYIESNQSDVFDWIHDEVRHADMSVESTSAGNFDKDAIKNGYKHTNALWNVEAGVNGGGWQGSTTPSVGTPVWAEADFRSAHTIDTINVYTLRNNVNDTSAISTSEVCTTFGNEDFDVEYWDGSAWQTIESVTANDKVWRQFTFTAVSTQKVRVSVTKARADDARLIAIEAMNGTSTLKNFKTVSDSLADLTKPIYPALVVVNSGHKTVFSGDLDITAYSVRFEVACESQDHTTIAAQARKYDKALNSMCVNIPAGTLTAGSDNVLHAHPFSFESNLEEMMDDAQRIRYFQPWTVEMVYQIAGGYK